MGFIDASNKSGRSFPRLWQEASNSKLQSKSAENTALRPQNWIVFG